jgi:kynureninase
VRQVIGDRLLIVDAVQGAGVVDAPWQVADVVVGSGQTWLRAGPGTGYLALNDRARERLTPVWSGWMAQGESEPVHEIHAPEKGAGAFRVSHSDPTAQARLAAGIEAVMRPGVGVIAPVVLERTARLLEHVDEVGLAVVSPRDDAERAGIVVVEPEPDQFGVLAAALHNHGVTATSREGRVRLSAHVSTGEETLALLRTALLTFRAATRA